MYRKPGQIAVHHRGFVLFVRVCQPTVARPLEDSTPSESRSTRSGSRLGLAALLLALAACGDSSNGSIDQKDTSSPELGTDTGTGTEDTEVAAETDTPSSGDIETTVPDTDADADTDPADVLDTTAPGDTTEPDAEEETEVTDADDVSEVAIEDEVTPPPDTDADGVPDADDLCPEGARNWPSNPETDHDGDGCRDSDEDTDDDNDGILDSDDACPQGLLTGPDHDTDGCRDDEDEDDDNDGAPDEYDECPRGATNWISAPATDGDNDGCRDSDEDFDLDGDGAPDDVDTCPGLFDPEQIDAWAPFGPGEGDVCNFGCALYERMDTVEHTTPDPSFNLLSHVSFTGSGTVTGFLKYSAVASAYSKANYDRYLQAYPGSLDVVRLYRIGAPGAADTRCVLYFVSSPQAPEAPLRVEVSSPGTLLSDLEGSPNAGVLLFPSGSPATDKDGDGLLEPWNPNNNILFVQYAPSTDHEALIRMRDKTTYKAVSTLFLGPGYLTQNVSYFGSGGTHLYVLTGPPPSGDGLGRLRIFLGQQLVEDIEVPVFPNGQATYIGEYISSPPTFVLRKRCALTNTLCSTPADCSSGPCVFRSFDAAGISYTREAGDP